MAEYGQPCRLDLALLAPAHAGRTVPFLAPLTPAQGVPASPHQGKRGRERAGPGLSCDSENLGEPGVVERAVNCHRAPGPGPSEHGTLLSLLSDPGTGIHVHLQHLHHPLVTTGSFKELIQGQPT